MVEDQKKWRTVNEKEAAPKEADRVGWRTDKKPPVTTAPEERKATNKQIEGDGWRTEKQRVVNNPTPQPSGSKFLLKFFLYYKNKYFLL